MFNVKADLVSRATHRAVEHVEGAYALRKCRNCGDIAWSEARWWAIVMRLLGEEIVVSRVFLRRSKVKYFSVCFRNKKVLHFCKTFYFVFALDEEGYFFRFLLAYVFANHNFFFE